jgi:D-arabinose 1-dehydrogenase-like Zn-dependent alcohol dehydrogenase
MLTRGPLFCCQLFLAMQRNSTHLGPAMKAIRLVRPGHPLEAHEVPLPQPGAHDVLIRVKAAGICHSDVHYRAGKSKVQPLPLTLGHEAAGVVEQLGRDVTEFQIGDRVCVHYLATCGACEWCGSGDEQFCRSAQMIGKHRDGGFAEYLAMPTRSVFKLPDEISFAHGAIMMCSSATSLHALSKARLQTGESIAIFGVGGLGTSALQLARGFEPSAIFAVDISRRKLELAKQYGAIPVNAATADPVAEIHRLTNGRGVDVSLELIGQPLTMQQAVRSLAIHGRAALVGIMDQTFDVAPYHEIINKEAEIIGVSDHLAAELPPLLEFARCGQFDLEHAVSRTIPLDAMAINETLDRLERYHDDLRVVITP